MEDGEEGGEEEDLTEKKKFGSGYHFRIRR